MSHRECPTFIIEIRDSRYKEGGKQRTSRAATRACCPVSSGKSVRAVTIVLNMLESSE